MDSFLNLYGIEFHNLTPENLIERWMVVDEKQQTVVKNNPCVQTFEWSNGEWIG